MRPCLLWAALLVAAVGAEGTGKTRTDISTELMRAENAVLEQTLALLDADGSKRRGPGEEKAAFMPMTARASLALDSIAKEELSTPLTPPPNKRVVSMVEDGMLGRRYSMRGMMTVLLVCTVLEMLSVDRLNRDPFNHEWALIKGMHDIPMLLRMVMTSKFMRDVYSTINIAYTVFILVDVMHAAKIDIGRELNAPVTSMHMAEQAVQTA